MGKQKVKAKKTNAHNEEEVESQEIFFEEYISFMKKKNGMIMI